MAPKKFTDQVAFSASQGYQKWGSNPVGVYDPVLIGGESHGHPSKTDLSKIKSIHFGAADRNVEKRKVSALWLTLYCSDTKGRNADSTLDKLSIDDSRGGAAMNRLRK